MVPSPDGPSAGDPDQPAPPDDAAIHGLLACPTCRVPVARAAVDALCCPSCGVSYRRRDGVWRFLPADRAARYQSFVADYQHVRDAEGRGSDQSSFYRALPFQDLTGAFPAQWAIRAHSFRVLRDQVLARLQTARGRPLRVVDVGAGNGWLSNQLALRGHDVIAVDLLVNPRDGLGARRHYLSRFLCAEAEFECLPVAEKQIDAVIFNASFHYATKYEATLGEALRVLAPGGVVVVVDSPIYRDAQSGRAMVREREETFVRDYGTRSDAMPTEAFLTWSRIDELAATLGLHWTILRPFYGLSWALSPLRARLRGRREPARFALLVGEKA